MGFLCLAKTWDLAEKACGDRAKGRATGICLAGLWIPHTPPSLLPLMGRACFGQGPFCPPITHGSCVFLQDLRSEERGEEVLSQLL